MQHSNPRNHRSRPDRNGAGARLWLPVIVIVIAVAVVLYFLLRDEPEPVPGETVVIEPQWDPFWEAGVDEPGPQYRVPEALAPRPPAAIDEESAPVDTEEQTVIEEEMLEPAKPLPPLDESDVVLQEELAGVADESELWDLFVPESLIRHFVVTVDNMTAAKLPEKFSFNQSPPGRLAVSPAEEEDTYYLDPANHDRYTRFVRFVEVINLDRMMSLYVRYYPLFQQAYVEMGYPQRYFNDRFVAVIDHLLATPDVNYPIKLKQPKVYYEFVDPELEALSAGQKLIIRTGPENSYRIRNRLRELRAALTTL